MPATCRLDYVAAARTGANLIVNRRRRKTTHRNEHTQNMSLSEPRVDRARRVPRQHRSSTVALSLVCWLYDACLFANSTRREQRVCGSIARMSNVEHSMSMLCLQLASNFSISDVLNVRAKFGTTSAETIEPTDGKHYCVTEIVV